MSADATVQQVKEMQLAPKSLARLTGLAYLAMIPGGIGFMTIRPKLLADTAQGTLENLVYYPDLARLGVAAVMSVVVAQALAALGFYAIYRTTKPVVAFGIAGFGLLNAAAILAGGAASSSAVALASTVSPQDTATAPIVHALYLFEGSAWNVGGLFFGLWLIPMGVGAATTKLFHRGRLLGAILMIGGVAYVLSAFLALHPAVARTSIPDALTALATLGEVWIMLALIIVGVRTESMTSKLMPGGRPEGPVFNPS